jgi:hypothetical protein
MANGNVRILGLTLGIVLLIGIIIVILLVVGSCCLCAAFSSQYSSSSSDSYSTPDYGLPENGDTPDGEILWDETKQVDTGYYMYYSAVLNGHTTLNIDLTSSDAVDFMIMDSVNFGNYVSAINSLDGGTWNNYVSEKFVLRESFTFTAPSTDRYYLVVDNTDSPEGGADVGKAVNIDITVTY